MLLDLGSILDPIVGILNLVICPLAELVTPTADSVLEGALGGLVRFVNTVFSALGGSAICD